MTRLLEKLAKTEFARDAAEQLARLEVNRRGCRRCLAIRVFCDYWNIVARIALRVAVYRVILEDAYYFRHLSISRETNQGMPRLAELLGN